MFLLANLDNYGNKMLELGKWIYIKKKDVNRNHYRMVDKRVNYESFP